MRSLQKQLGEMLATGSKGQLGGLTTMSLSIVVFVVVVVAGALILSTFASSSIVNADNSNLVVVNATYTYASSGTNASTIVQQGKTGLGSLMSWLPLIIIIVIAVMILGYFGLRTQGRSKGGA